MKTLPLILLAVSATLPLQAELLISDTPAQGCALNRPVGKVCLQAQRDGKTIALLERKEEPYLKAPFYSIHFDKSITADEAEAFLTHCVLHCLRQHAGHLHIDYSMSECPAWTARYREHAEAKLGRKLVYESEHNEHAQEAFRSYIESIFSAQGIPLRHIRYAYIGDMELDSRGDIGGGGSIDLLPGPRHERIGYGDAAALIAAGTDAEGNTPLHRLAAWGLAEDLSRLLTEGATPDVANKDGITPLHLAARNGQSDCVRALLQAGADVNARNTLKWDAYGPTALHYAANEGWSDCLSLLLEAGAQVDAGARDGETPLHHAARRGHVDALRQLLAAGASVNAATTGYPGEEQEYSLANRIGSTPLHEAAHAGARDAIEILLAAGADVNKGDAIGSTPLDRAAESHRTACVEQLLKAGASVNAATSYGSTPLSGAIWQPGSPMQIDIMRLLLAAGSDVNAQLSDGRSLLHGAVQYGNEAVMKLLLEAGAKPEVADNEGNTALHVAAQQGSVPCVQLLLKAGVNADVRDDKGETPLHKAAAQGKDKAVKLLLDAGADPKLRDAAGKSALDHAAVDRYWDEPTRRLLRKAGAK